MKSMCRNFSPCVPCAPMNVGLSNQRKPASRPSIARVAATAVSSEITVPISSISAKPLTPAVGDREQHERGDARHGVRVENRVEALRVARADRGADGFAGTHLFLDALEHDDVRVGCDADREDQSREPRQRERHAEEEDRAVQKRRVDAEAEDRDDAHEAVEQEQEDRDAIRPPIAAFFACWSESLPSVAETFVLSSVLKSYGSEPVWSTSARFFASLKPLSPVICALPLMPLASELSV